VGGLLVRLAIPGDLRIMPDSEPLGYDT
jgi:hypothetical protein